MLWISGVILLVACAITLGYPLVWQQAQKVTGHSIVTTLQSSPRTSPPSKSMDCASQSVPGILSVPSIGLIAPVEQGISSSVLNSAVGHDPSTNDPGPGVGALLLSHDVGYFSHLDDLHPGSLISYSSTCTTFDYKVINTQISHPGNKMSVPMGGGLILSTCWPLNALWWTTQRFVVTAQYLKSSSNLGKLTFSKEKGDQILVPAPASLVATGLNLNSFPQAMGTLSTSNSSPQWLNSPGPLAAVNAVERDWIGLYRSVEAQNPSWWHALAPFVPYSSSLPKRLGALNIALSAPNGSVGSISAIASDINLSVNITISNNTAEIVSVTA